MKNLLKKIFGEKETLTHKTVDGKVVLVKDWPCKENSDLTWGRLGFDSLYK